jgi:mRNA interferase MazF
MQPGNIVLIEMPQPDGTYKLRPALILKILPKYNDFLVCGISTQLKQYVQGFDEILYNQQSYFLQTGLRESSLIRLFFIAVVSNEKVSGSIGSIPVILHRQLLERLAGFLIS